MPDGHNDAPIPFAQVLDNEIATLAGPEAGENKRRNLSAICLSGGGIRSATFNLGILEGLAAAGLLDKFDYLSTVSGGGYIGSWLSSWIHRADHGNDPAAVTEMLGRAFHGGKEIDQVRFLRDYSNYLTPRVGALTGDTWTLFGIYLRNLVINWLMLVPFFFAILVLPRLYIAVLARHLASPAVLWAGLALSALGIFCTCADLPTFALPWKSARKACRACFLPFLVFSAVFLSLYWAAAYPEQRGDTAALTQFVESGAAIFFSGWALSSLFYLCTASRRPVSRQEPERPDRVKWSVIRFICSNLAALVAGAVGGLFCYWLSIVVFPVLPVPAAEAGLPLLYATLAVPAIVTAFLLAGLVHILLMNALTGDEDREWWARSGAYLMMVVCGWLVLFAGVIYGPILLDFHNVETLWQTIGISGAIGIVTALLGKSSRTPSPVRGAEQKENPFVAIGLHIAAVAFILLLVASLSSLASVIVHPVPHEEGGAVTACATAACRPAGNTPQPAGAAKKTASASAPASSPHLASFCCKGIDYLGLLFLLPLAFSLLVGWVTNPNKFSLHALYRLRLIRAYLGATRGKDETGQDRRKPHPFTGFDPYDNVLMKDLPPRPLHILNMAWNVVGGGKLGWQERKAVSFTASKLHCGCGNEGFGYRPSAEYGVTPGLGSISLGTAMAISGAAASPNMGYHSSPLVTFVMAFFNVRLGWWLGNPKDQTAWQKSGPRVAFWPMLMETFGNTGTDSTFIYLSDGGHFENLGLYEMARRRCRYIVIGDGSSDKERTFADLGNAIRKVRVDLGTEIDIDIDELKPKLDKRDGLMKSRSHFVRGRIVYPKLSEDDEDNVGCLLYIKPSLCDELPIDIFNYARLQCDFPHQTTADQWFNESQFESYRKLGLHSMKKVAESCGRQTCDTEFTSVAELFEELTEK